MNLIKLDTYEIKTSRTEQKVPVVNGVHLHSIYNPYKEAENLTEKYREVIEEKSEILILGLGFAYHVNEISEKLQKTFGNNYKIIVIEPNIQVYNDCLDLGLLNKKNLLVYAGFTASELYADTDLVHFLLSRPTVIAHPPSFNLYQEYFKEFLSFEAPTTIHQSLPFISNNEIKNYLSQFQPGSKFIEVISENISEKTELTGIDFLAMALLEITKMKPNKSSSTNGDA